MKTQLIKIGNSKGVRLPKTILKQCNLDGDLEIEVKDNKIIIHAENNPRAGWNELFKKANSDKFDSMIDGDGNNLSSWDENEWQWK